MKKAKIRNFKGLHTTQDKKQLQPDFSNSASKFPTCNNFMPEYDGSISKITGGSRVNTAYTTPIKPIHEYRLSSGEIFALFWANNLLYNENISTGVISQITIPAGITITSGGYFSETFADKIYYSDGTNELVEIYYTPSTATWTVGLASLQSPVTSPAVNALSLGYSLSNNTAIPNTAVITYIIEHGDFIYVLYTLTGNTYLAQFDVSLNLNQAAVLVGANADVTSLIAVDAGGNAWVPINNAGWRLQQYNIQTLAVGLYKTMQPTRLKCAPDGIIYAGWVTAGVPTIVRIRDIHLISGQPTLFDTMTLAETAIVGFDFDVQTATGNLLVVVGKNTLNKMYIINNTFTLANAVTVTINCSTPATVYPVHIESSSLYTYVYYSSNECRIYDASNAYKASFTIAWTDGGTIEDDVVGIVTAGSLLEVRTGNGNIVTPTALSIAITALGHSVSHTSIVYATSSYILNRYIYPYQKNTIVSGVTSVKYAQSASNSNNIYVENGGNITEFDTVNNIIGRQWVGSNMVVDTSAGDKIYNLDTSATYGTLTDKVGGGIITLDDTLWAYYTIPGPPLDIPISGHSNVTNNAIIAVTNYFIWAGSQVNPFSGANAASIKFYSKTGSLQKTVATTGAGYCLASNDTYATYLYTSGATRVLGIQALSNITIGAITLDITAVSTNLNGIAIDNSNNVYTLSGTVLKKYNSSLTLQATYGGTLVAPTATNTRCLTFGTISLAGVSTDVIIVSAGTKVYILDTSFNLLQVYSWDTGDVLNSIIKGGEIYTCVNLGGTDTINILSLYNASKVSSTPIYEYTVYNADKSQETTGSPASIPVNLVGQTAQLVMPVTTYSKNIYRNINGTYYLIGNINANATSFIDRVSDEQALLQNIVIPLYNFPAPKGLKYLTAHKNYLFGSNTDNQVVFSDLNNPTVFPPQNLLQAPNNQGEIKAIKSSLLDHLLIFQDDAITHIAGTGYGYASQYTNDLGFYQYTSSKTVGTINHNTIRITDTPEGAKCYFLSDKGIFEYGGQQPQPIHLGIIPTYKSINGNADTLATAGVNPATNEYWLCVPITATTYNDKVLVWNYGLREWYTRDDCYSAITAVEGTSGYEMRGGWSTSATNGYYHKLQGQYYQGINYTGTLTGGVLSPAPTIDMTGLPATNGTVFTTVTSITGSTPTFASAIPDGAVYIGDIYANFETPDIDFGDAFTNKQIKWLQLNNTGALNMTPTVCYDSIAGTDTEAVLTKITGLTGLSKRYMGGIFSHYRLKFDSWDFNTCSLKEINFIYEDLKSMR